MDLSCDRIKVPAGTRHDTFFLNLNPSTPTEKLHKLKMGKSETRSSKAAASYSSAKNAITPIPTTTSAIASDPILGYKMRVLLHDFLAVTKDQNAAKRLNSTADEHYISEPYFDNDQAAAVKAALVDIDLTEHNPTAAATEYAQEDMGTGGEGQGFAPNPASLRGATFRCALEALLESFLDKRRASEDARPCGPHHLAPLYAWLFGIRLEEVRDEKFLGRLRRTGV
jgi:hypothetical protein